MKKLLVSAGVLLLVSGIGYGWFTLVNSKTYTYIDSKLKTERTVEGTLWEIKSAGVNFRQYSWIDPYGRMCTAAVSNKDGMLPADCDFESIPVKF